MFKFPYETTPCAAYNLADIRKALQHAMIEGQLSPAHTLKGNAVDGVLAVPPYVKSVPTFAHPVSFDYHGKESLVIDTRAFVSQKMSGETRVTDPTSYQFLVLRGALTALWSSGSVSDLAQLGDFPVKVFSRLLAEGIVRRLGLTPGDQMRLMALAGYWHLCQYIDGAQIHQDTGIKLAGKVARATAISVEKVLEVMDLLAAGDNTYPVIGSIEAFIVAAKDVVQSSRMEMLNLGLIYGSVGGVWFGANAREIVAVALEYPPVFLAMMYMALNDRTFHAAMFTKLVEQSKRGDVGDDFVKRVTKLLEHSAHV
jgi:hypothetical protein